VSQLPTNGRPDLLNHYNYLQNSIKSNSLDTIASNNIIDFVSQSFELLGGFREKVVSTFDSPF